MAPSRIQSSGPSRLGTSTHLQSAQQSAKLPNLGEQLEDSLFGRRKPPPLDWDDFPELHELLRILRRFKGILARLRGDAEEDYDLVLCDGEIAMIDVDGNIYMGRQFLLAFHNRLEVLIGALAHEVGHQPKRLKAEQEFLRGAGLSRDELNERCRHEETRADIFAGRALGELGLDCEPMCEFLLRVQTTPHPEYWPAAVRADVIREAHRTAFRKAKAQKKHFPAVYRRNSPRFDMGEL